MTFSPKYQKWFKILAPLLGLLLMVLMTLILWVQKLEHQIKVSMEKKTFFAQKEYYTAPEYYYIEQQFSFEKWVLELKNRGYREKLTLEKVAPGSYLLLPLLQCKNLVPDTLGLDDLFSQCLFFRNPTTLDPELNLSPPQLIFFDPTGQLVKRIYRGNPLIKTEIALLEPQIFAQYLENEPIMQKYTPLGEIPPSCLNAVLSIEDVHFLDHHGVSATGLLRAFWTNLIHRRTSQGGSTITQQMVKNHFLTPERTLKRKFLEFFISLAVERISTKDEILETYLNILYMGQSGAFQVRGFGAASNYYFSKPLQELTLNECALLAAILNSPGLYNPFKNQEKAKERRNLVLSKMQEYQFISEEEKKTSTQEPLNVIKKEAISETAPYYIHATNQQLKELGVLPSSRYIFTGINVQQQRIAQSALLNHIQQLEKSNKNIIKFSEKNILLEGIFIGAQPKIGVITALIGGRNFKQTQYNRAIDSRRQIGSIMKPLVYLNALIRNNDLNPLSTIKDVEFTYKIGSQSWSPENYEKKFEGDVPLYFALKNSLNSATAALGIEYGLDSLVDLTKTLGVKSRLEPFPSLTLGAFELTPLEVVNMYATLSQLGAQNQSKLTFVRSSFGEDFEPLFEYKKKESQVLPPNKVAVLIGMMEETIKSGTAKSVWNSGYHRPCAGKTGTTSDYKDSWFVGFTPYQTSLAWVGFDDNSPHRLTGASGALPIWLYFMKETSSSFPDTDFSWPSGVEKKTVSNRQTPTPSDTATDVAAEASTTVKTTAETSTKNLETEENRELVFEK